MAFLHFSFKMPFLSCFFFFLFILFIQQCNLPHPVSVVLNAIPYTLVQPIRLNQCSGSMLDSKMIFQSFCWRFFFSLFLFDFYFFPRKKNNSSLCSFDDNDFNSVVDNIWFSMILYSVKVSWPFLNVIDSVWPRILKIKKEEFFYYCWKLNNSIYFGEIRWLSWELNVSCFPSCLSVRSDCQFV